MSDRANATDETPRDLGRWMEPIQAFQAWIDDQDPQAAKHWADRLKSNDPTLKEGAVAEAVAWDWLGNRVDWIGLVTKSSRKTPDFRCVKEGSEFFVEVTNVSRAAMTEATGLPDTDAEPRSQTYRSPSKRLHGEILRKVEQGLELAAPYLVFVTTLHWNGSTLLVDRDHLEEVLTSRSFLSATYDLEHGGMTDEPRNTLDFKHAAFTGTMSLLPKRTHVSGTLFGPFGLYPTGLRVHGILNPTATWPFDPRLLPDAPFCRFRQWPPPRANERSLVEWTDEPASESSSQRIRDGR